MIELTSDQRQALLGPGVHGDVVETNTPYLLVRKAVYDRMKDLLHDPSSWNEEEMDLLAEEAGELLDNYQP